MDFIISLILYCSKNNIGLDAPSTDLLEKIESTKEEARKDDEQELELKSQLDECKNVIISLSSQLGNANTQKQIRNKKLEEMYAELTLLIFGLIKKTSASRGNGKEQAFGSPDSEKKMPDNNENAMVFFETIEKMFTQGQPDGDNFLGDDMIQDEPAQETKEKEEDKIVISIPSKQISDNGDEVTPPLVPQKYIAPYILNIITKQNRFVYATEIAEYLGGEQVNDQFKSNGSLSKKISVALNRLKIKSLLKCVDVTASTHNRVWGKPEWLKKPKKKGKIKTDQILEGYEHREK